MGFVRRGVVPNMLAATDWKTFCDYLISMFKIIFKIIELPTGKILIISRVAYAQIVV